MLGLVLNTHAQWLGRQLTDAGYVVSRQMSVADAGVAITEAVRESLSRADFLVVTGGLGSTSDDLTRQLIAELLGKKLVMDETALATIKEFFKTRGRVMPASAAVQAQVPEGAMVLQNPNGTAPGLAIPVNPNPFRNDRAASRLVMLPGPPRELRPMFTNLYAALAPGISRAAWFHLPHLADDGNCGIAGGRKDFERAGTAGGGWFGTRLLRAFGTGGCALDCAGHRGSGTGCAQRNHRARASRQIYLWHAGRTIECDGGKIANTAP